MRRIKHSGRAIGKPERVSKRGGALDVHNQVRQVRVAIAATSPGLKVPNVLLLARTVLPEQSPRQARFRHTPLNARFELTRLLPLCFIKISIHDMEKKQLRFKMATGRTFYLQLCPPVDNQPDNFESWVKVIHLLRPPSKFSQESKDLDPQNAWKALATPPSGESILHTPVDPTIPPLQDGESNLLETLSTVPEEGPVNANPSESWDSPYTVLDPAVGLPPASNPLAETDLQPETPPPSEGETPKEKLDLSPEGAKTERPRDRPVASRRSTSQNKPSKPRRSHSSKRAVSRSPSKISTLFMSSFSGRRHRKGAAKKAKEKQR
ncbi:hypothetical protein JRQ81_009575 [Phrynocephalus forsythii]|uniref:Golgi associated RAB2 interactor protein-like Rab2B-binding domain-containing protein n=1 Tax=Phrynocephalus forsythii TaxID=171643 RepID=A0A9Q1ASE5_9SAUR|nr:hypothetical protein JRQ81_009575 [Phrynocephalus forsythii]